MNVYLHRETSPIEIRRIRSASYSTRKDENLLEEFVDSAISPGSKKCVLCGCNGKKMIVHIEDRRIHALGVCSRAHIPEARLKAERSAKNISEAEQKK